MQGKCSDFSDLGPNQSISGQITLPYQLLGEKFPKYRNWESFRAIREVF
jgi:hypothetical protein